MTPYTYPVAPGFDRPGDGHPRPHTTSGDPLGTGPHLSLHTAMDLIEGLDRGQLFLEDQPVVDLRSDRVTSVEALVRWEHPERGVLRPDQFLPQAQRSRLGPVITTFVLEEAAAQWKRWSAAGMKLTVAVNVPPLELTDRRVPGTVEALIEDGFDATYLTIEVTERRVPDIAIIAPALERLRELDVRLSVDDFGTGDSSLTRVQELNFHELKIDRSFVAQVQNTGPGRTIVRFAAALAHDLGMDVVAEGVEAADQLVELRDLDVDLVQGYHLGRPGTADVVADLVLHAS